MSHEPDFIAITEADERLLALLREHAIDAEVAVRLGVSVGDVKDRIERLKAKLGCRRGRSWRHGGRAAPAGWPRAMRSNWRIVRGTQPSRLSHAVVDDELFAFVVADDGRSGWVPFRYLDWAMGEPLPVTVG